MATKAALANGASKEEAKYLPLIDKYLREIKSIQQDLDRKRAAGRDIVRRIDRNLKEIQTIIDRVEATL